MKTKSIQIQPQRIQDIHWGFTRPLVLSTAIDLDIFAVIHSGNTTTEKIARAVNAPLRSTRMLLDALVGMQILDKTKGTYKLTAEAKAFLVKNEPGYLGSFLQFNEPMVQSWFQLTNLVKTGKPLQQKTSEEDRRAFFVDLVKRIFPISYASALILSKKLGAGKSLKSQKILDVGCGSAAWSIAFALADPAMQVVGVDYPEVLEVAQSYVQRFRLQKQYELRAGDFRELEFGNAAYDIIILGQICHGEGEAGTRKLFKKSYDALKRGGKLLVAEFIPNDLRTGPELPLLFALNMLLFTEQGDVFTAKELKRWLNFAGFKKVSAQEVQYPVTVMVATK